MQTSNAFRATSISFITASLLFLEGCGAGGETAGYTDQCYYFYASSRSSLPEFDATLFRMADSSGQRLDVYVTLRENRLKFERKPDAFRAMYTANIRLQRADGPPVVRELPRVVQRDSYPAASDSSYDAFLVSFDVAPGQYTMEISVTDSESGQKVSRRYRKSIPEGVDHSVSLSDIMLLARSDSSDHGRKITPFILPNAGLLGDTLQFFTVLSGPPHSADSVWFNFYKLQSRERPASSFGGVLFSARATGIDPCHARMDTILVHKYSTAISLGKESAFVFGFVPKPHPGNYLLEVRARGQDEVVSTATLPIAVRAKSFPDVSEDLGMKLASLGYIASRSEIEKLTNARTDSLVRKNLLKFWSDYGGYVKMSDYYKRVSQANRFFSTCLDGWQTPMGMFYIICGPPDYVECRGAYSERWIYVNPSTNDRVVVDFRLTRETENPEERYYGIENVYSNLDFWSFYVSRWRTPY